MIGTVDTATGAFRRVHHQTEDGGENVIFSLQMSLRIQKVFFDYLDGIRKTKRFFCSEIYIQISIQL